MKFIWTCMLFLVGHLIAGGIYQTQKPLHIFLQFLPVPGFHSVGFRNIISTPISDIGLANPVVLDNWSRMNVGVSFGYHTSIPDFAQTQDPEITLSQHQPGLPVAAGWVLPINNGRIGLAYHQSYNFHLTTGEFPVSTASQDTVAMTRYIEHEVIHSFSGVVSYSFPDFIRHDDRLTLGATMTIDYLRFYSEVFEAYAEMNDYGFSFKMGISYRLPRFAIGLVYQHQTSVEGDMKLYSELQTPSPVKSNVYYTKLPTRYGMGIHWVASEKWQLNGTVTYVLWEQLPYEYTNALNYSGSVLWSVGENWNVSGGFFRRGLNRGDTYQDNSYTYLVGGLRYQKERWDMFLEVWDNHVNAEEDFQHTYFVVGAGIRLF